MSEIENNKLRHDRNICIKEKKTIKVKGIIEDSSKSNEAELRKDTRKERNDSNER